MPDWKERTALLIGAETVEKLAKSKVAVVGLGGVGGICAESLCRAGIGRLVLCDYDVIDITNLNRQIFATHDWIGKHKTEAAVSRIRSINPECCIEVINQAYGEQTRESFFSLKPDYVADAIDMVTAKLDLVKECKNRNVPVISCMGAGNRLDPSSFQVCDIYQTANCALARVMRRELKKLGVMELDVVCSGEPAKKNNLETPDNTGGKSRRRPPASISVCPNAAGLVLAGSIITNIICKG
ncbi:MAG: tRNA threonylcarbamoyladenosine dehydratase [Oscillospiraceae bacterium]|nr:tRNA threonylcarbamoyladenosine dehydratase [Oscillospiraceae bacterium]